MTQSDQARARELLHSLACYTSADPEACHPPDVERITAAFAEVRRDTLDTADRTLRRAETPELPDGQAIGLSLAREVLANLAGRYRLGLAPEPPDQPGAERTGGT